MRFRRTVIAAAVLLAAIYLKYAMPSFSEELMASFRRASETRQAVVLPDAAAAWLGLD